MVSSAWGWLAHGTETACVPPTCSSTTIPVFLQLVCRLNGGEALRAAVFQELIRTRRDVLGYLPAPNHREEPECREKQGLILEVLAESGLIPPI